jgi:hypothetical protein
VLELVPEKFHEAVAVQTPYHWAGAYVLVALLLLGLAYFPGEQEKKEMPASSVN